MKMASKLAKSDYTKTSLGAYFLQTGMNYNNYQGLGYASILYPGLRKIYKDDDQLKDALLENIEFFNTNPSMVPFITNLHLSMLDGGADPKEVKGIKMALMGPMAGIGDSMSQFCLAPLFATIGASMAQDGLLMGPLFFFLGINITLLIVKLLMGSWGHKLGTSIITQLSGYMEQISAVAGMIGVTVISGLAVNFVKIKTPLQYVAQLSDGEQNVIAIQDMLDAMLPNLLPVLFTCLVFWLIKKKKWTTYRLVILTIIVGVALSAVGILG